MPENYQLQRRYNRLFARELKAGARYGIEFDRLHPGVDPIYLSEVALLALSARVGAHQQLIRLTQLLSKIIMIHNHATDIWRHPNFQTIATASDPEFLTKILSLSNACRDAIRACPENRPALKHRSCLQDYLVRHIPDCECVVSFCNKMESLGKIATVRDIKNLTIWQQDISDVATWSIAIIMELTVYGEIIQRGCDDIIQVDDNGSDTSVTDEMLICAYRRSLLGHIKSIKPLLKRSNPNEVASENADA